MLDINQSYISKVKREALKLGWLYLLRVIEDSLNLITIDLIRFRHEFTYRKYFYTYYSKFYLDTTIGIVLAIHIVLLIYISLSEFFFSSKCLVTVGNICFQAYFLRLLLVKILLYLVA